MLGPLTYGTLSSAGFTPLSIDGLVVWLDAGEGMYQDTGGTTLAVNDGDPVALWQDQSGGGNNVNQAITGYRPTLKLNILNSKSVVRFTNTSNHSLRSGAFASALSQPNTIFIVASITNTSNERYLFDGLTSSARHSIRLNNAGNIVAYAGTDVNLLYAETSSSMATCILTTKFNGASSVLRKNGAPVDYGNVGAHAMDGLALGINYAGTVSVDMSGDIAEVLVYDAGLSDAEMVAVEEYLSSKYALSLAPASLPSGASAENAAAALTIPTYDGSGQAVHPDVYDAGNGNTWNGYRYWMAMTPYPNADNTKENPSIIASNDGDTWAEPAGISNPLEAYPGSPGYNSDPALVYSGGSLYCFFRQTTSGTTDTVYSLSSSDGVTWGSRTSVITGAIGTLASPAFVHNGAEWVMWHVDTSAAAKRTLKMRTSAALTSGWSAASTCIVYNLPSGKDVWHIHALWTGTVYRAFVMVSDKETSGSAGVLYYGESSDGISWYLQTAALLSPSGGANWDSASIYRSSGVPVGGGGGYDLWYSAVDVGNEWHIGRTTVTI